MFDQGANWAFLISSAFILFAIFLSFKSRKRNIKPLQVDLEPDRETLKPMMCLLLEQIKLINELYELVEVETDDIDNRVLDALRKTRAMDLDCLLKDVRKEAFVAGLNRSDSELTSDECFDKWLELER